MSAMLAAIKKRQQAGASVMGDHQDTGHQAEHVQDDPAMNANHGADLHGLVKSLSESEKHSLRTILEKDKTGGDGQNIAKGAPSKEEQGKIAQASQQENQENALEEASETKGQEMDEDKSDEIAKSMLDSRHLRGMATEKPRNLGERMKQGLAAKLKSKGKI